MIDRKEAKAMNESGELKVAKSKTKIKKKPLIFIMLVAFLLVVSTTYAFFTSTVSFYNRFQVMTYDVSLTEEGFTGNWGAKKVFINNNESSTPVVVRVSYSEIWSKDVNGKLDFLSTKVGSFNVVDKAWGVDYKDFIDGNDGWYYYTKVLEANGQIQFLDSISLNEELVTSSPDAEKYKTYDYELTFTYEAIQADSKAVKESWDKNIIIDGDNVTWSS